ncbi:MAG: Uma2 family endonuclease [Dehalococcoidia bacterium]|nr:Uma2 family endonuclease [Dehalococcoidia bacterium]
MALPARVDQGAEYRPSPYHGQRMSLDAYLALPEEKPYLEWWDGVVIQKAPGNMPYSRALLKFIVWLDRYADSHAGEVATQAHTWFEGHGYLVPDVSYYVAGRPVMARYKFGLPPSLSINVWTPGNTVAELREKCRQMRANGVDVCWLILPEERAAELFDADHDGTRLTGDAVLATSAVPGFEVSLAELFALLD